MKGIRIYARRKKKITSSGNRIPLAFFIASALCYINGIFRKTFILQFTRVERKQNYKLYGKS